MFTTLVGAATVPALALAWAVGACMALVLICWGVFSILTKQHTLSSPLLSLILVGVIALTVIGTSFVKDGLDRSHAKPRPTVRAALGALGDALKDSIDDLARRIGAASQAVAAVSEPQVIQAPSQPAVVLEAIAVTKSTGKGASATTRLKAQIMGANVKVELADAKDHRRSPTGSSSPSPTSGSPPSSLAGRSPSGPPGTTAGSTGGVIAPTAPATPALNGATVPTETNPAPTTSQPTPAPGATTTTTTTTTTTGTSTTAP